jgi:hypothetical protein
MKTYPGARHGFDAPRPPHDYAGHYVGQDPAALADSLIETRRFSRRKGSRMGWRGRGDMVAFSRVFAAAKSLGKTRAGRVSS